jgi:flagellar hook-basal body complex protein FliE
MAGEELSIQQIRSLMDTVPGAKTPEVRPIKSNGPEDVGKAGGPSFADTLKESIAEVNDLKLQADAAIEKLATGESTDIQETIMAVEKADVSFKLMMEVRSKILNAYQEVMRTQV